MLEPILALTGLVFSAFFSASEMAFIQANPLQIKVWQKQGHRFAEKASSLLSEPERFLTTTLIGNNLANVLTSSYATVTLLTYGIPKLWTIISITFIILFFGEVVPKVITRNYATTVTITVSPILRFWEVLISPLVWVIKVYSKLIAPQIHSSTSPGQSSPKIFTRKDLKVLFKETETIEDFELEEKEVIAKIFEFSSRPVWKVMTPRSDFVAVELNFKVEQAAKILSETGFSKLPVYEGSPDNLIGVIFLQDIFQQPESLNSIIRPPLFITESVPANQVLQTMKRRKSSIAFVVDKDGKTTGLVTIEDLVEELFGEFEDVFASSYISRRVI